MPAKKPAWQNPKIKQAERAVNRLYGELKRASARYLALVKPTDAELALLADGLWDNIGEDLTTEDFPQWPALLADAIIDQRKHGGPDGRTT